MSLACSLSTRAQGQKGSARGCCPAECSFASLDTGSDRLADNRDGVSREGWRLIRRDRDAVMPRLS
jgi:hypothetical protein